MYDIWIKLCLITALFISGSASAQQVADNDFEFEIDAPYFSEKHPHILMDRFHSPYVEQGSVQPLVKLLQADGAKVDYGDKAISTEVLAEVDIFVTVNPYRRNFEDFSIMEPPSAYNNIEISVIRQWVKDGGKLWIIADHQPFAGGAAKLAEAFGITFLNGYTLKTSMLPKRRGLIVYKPGYGLNTNHSMFDLIDQTKLEYFSAFTGQAIIPPDNSTPVLTIPNGYSAVFVRPTFGLIPRSAFTLDVSGFSQGMSMVFGKGRVAAFGEAGGFTAQIANGKPFGFNERRGRNNPYLILATEHWLASGN